MKIYGQHCSAIKGLALLLQAQLTVCLLCSAQRVTKSSPEAVYCATVKIMRHSAASNFLSECYFFH